MRRLFRGFSSFFKAFGFIFKHRLAKWYLVPVLLWMVMVIGFTFSLASMLSDPIHLWLDQWFDVDSGVSETGFWPTVKFWMHKILTLASGFLLHLLIIYFLGRLMKYVILIITSPLLAWISEKTEALLSGKDYPFSWFQLAKDALRGVLITFRNLAIESLLVALVFLLTLVFPLWGVVFTAMLFLVNCYFMGFSMFDYIVERRKFGLKQSVGFMRSHRMELVGLGLAFNLCSLLPFADWVIAPINGAVGAVLCLEEESAETIA